MIYYNADYLDKVILGLFNIESLKKALAKFEQEKINEFN